MRTLCSWRRVRLTLVRERSDTPYSMPSTLRSGRDAVALLRAVLRDDPREQFVAIYLDQRHRPIGVHICSVGTAGSAPVHPREVFGPALLASASAVIVAHNHPSGDTTPSPEDRAVTARLQAAGELLGIPMLDHIILGDGRFYSFEADASFEIE